MRTMEKTTANKNNQNNQLHEQKTLNRLTAYQKMVERNITRQRPNRNMIRRG